MNRPLDETQESVNTVIADRARTRSVAELWTTAIGGGMNAIFLWVQFPSLHWLAASCTAVAAYGLWGLADRAISIVKLQNDEPPAAVGLLEAARNIAAAGGWIAALGAAAELMTVLVGHLALPGG